MVEIRSFIANSNDYYTHVYIYSVKTAVISKICKSRSVKIISWQKLYSIASCDQMKHLYMHCIDRRPHSNEHQVQHAVVKLLYEDFCG